MSNVITFSDRTAKAEPEFMDEWRAYFRAELSSSDMDTALRRADAHRAYLIRKRDEDAQDDEVLGLVRESMGASHA